MSTPQKEVVLSMRGSIDRNLNKIQLNVIRKEQGKFLEQR
jgi:hypothetical protein